MLSPNTILRERYRIIHQLGHGGMGAVYQAMDENLSCVVAVKETFAANDEQRRAFKREAELLANLSHPTLPRVIEHFSHSEGQFLVMQYVPGHDLAELLDLREQPFAVAKVLDWADQLLDALEELHSSNPPIIHRDIKPSNLKVTPKGRVLLLDFGLAKGSAGQMSTAEVDSRGRSIYGYTPNYAPLEQIRNAGTDARSDLYALAATLWTLLTAKVPPDALSRVGEKEEGNPDPLQSAHEINAAVPLAVSKALNSALALNRNNRHASAAEFREELRRARESKSEVPTLLKQEPQREPGSTERRPSESPPLKPTEYHPTAPSSADHHVPTMHVDAPPKVPSWSGAATANSLAVEETVQKRSSKRLAFIAVGVLVLAFAAGLFIWRPWVEAEQGSNTTNSSLANNAPTGMAYVPGGLFVMGRDGGDEYEKPAHSVTVKPFFIDLYEVTREDYKKCVDEQKCPPPQGWTNGSYPEGTARQPVTSVTWDVANAYAQWADKRLPTEEEWEFAARGTDGRRYPWGKDWQPGYANANGARKGLAKVGEYTGASPFGSFDMVGNAWEWTASKLTPYPGGSLQAQPSGDVRVIRGGSYDENANEATTTYRGFLKVSGDKYDKTGFRCVKDVKDGTSAQ